MDDAVGRSCDAFDVGSGPLELLLECTRVEEGLDEGSAGPSETGLSVLISNFLVAKDRSIPGEALRDLRAQVDWTTASG